MPCAFLVRRPGGLTRQSTGFGVSRHVKHMPKFGMARTVCSTHEELRITTDLDGMETPA
jgi:hypothetical protein